MPAIEGFAVVRQSFPEDGGILDQSSWMMWAFDVIRSEVMISQKDLKSEQEIAQQHKTAHARITKGSQ